MANPRPDVELSWWVKDPANPNRLLVVGSASFPNLEEARTFGRTLLASRHGIELEIWDHFQTPSAPCTLWEDY